MPTISHEIDRSLVGVPGIDGFLFTVEVRPSAGLTGSTKPIQDTREREFRVVAALGKYAPFPAGISASIAESEGSSYFIVPQNVTGVDIKGPSGALRVFTNKAGELARVEQVCVATGWNDAFLKFTRALAPFLDHVSYVADVPVVVEKLYCHDAANGVHVASFKTPYAPTP